MKSWLLLRWRLPLALVCVSVALLTGNSAWASAQSEFRAAVKSFEGGFWGRAEGEFAQFVEKHPDSELTPQAIVFQAKAKIKQGKFSETIALLSKPLSVTNRLADEFLFWKGEAQLRSTNYADAAATFGKLAGSFEASPLRLQAAVNEAAARAKLGEWSRVVELLKMADGSFQKAARGAPESESASRGFLLLAEAELQQRSYREAEAALRLISAAQLPLELAWQKQYLFCRSQLGDGRALEALGSSTNLMAVAESGNRRDLLAESVAFRAGIFEQLGRFDEARSMFKLNLADAPPERQRQALAKIAELALAQNRPGDALQTLETFVTQFTNTPATDLALLTLGELYLKQHLSSAASNGPDAGLTMTNFLSQALTNFDRLISAFPNSPLAGRAQLDRGWCFWSDKKITGSAEAFQAAIAKLSPSEDLAVARFKLADAQFVLKDFTNALQNYRSALAVAEKWPRVKAALASQCLYQELRASLELKDMAGATNAMQKILTTYPQSAEADRSVLLVAQGFLDLNDPDEARASFQKFLETFSDSPLRAEVELAMARAAEQRADWPAAIARYDAWLDRFATNGLRPQAEFHRALAHFYNGNDDKALMGLTNFVANFPTNDLAGPAYWWVADHFLRRGDLREAEFNFKNLSQKLPSSPLSFEARMMAGKLALDRKDYAEARESFTNLTSNPTCPRDLRIQATFAYGSVFMQQSPGGTNELANFQKAIAVFTTIQQDYPDTEYAALAWGEIAKCNRQLASQGGVFFTNAIFAYQQVVNSPQANIAPRSEAKVGLGLIAEALAETRSGEAKTALLRQARDQYLDVFYYEKILRDGEQPELFWVKQAGLNAARVIESAAETPEDWEQARKVYQDLQKLLPPLSASLDKKIDRVRERLALQGK